MDNVDVAGLLLEYSNRAYSVDSLAELRILIRKLKKELDLRKVTERVCCKEAVEKKPVETADKAFKNATYKAMSMIYEALLDTNKVFTSKEAEDAVGDALYDMKCAVEEDN